MKIGIAGFSHETITFWPEITDLSAFERTAHHGSDVIEKSRGVNSCIGGFVEVLEAEGIEMVPICDARGGATATVSDAVYDFYAGKMFRGFADAAGELDGIWLQFTSHQASLIDEDPFLQCGVKPQDFDIIVTKSKTHFRAVYEKVGAEIIIIDAPGQCPADIGVFEYRNAPQVRHFFEV